MVTSVKAVAERLNVSQHSVLTWIRNGELAAIDVSRHRGSPPKWRIPEEAIQAFLTSRQSTPRIERTRKRRNESEDVIEFYK